MSLSLYDDYTDQYSHECSKCDYKEQLIDDCTELFDEILIQSFGLKEFNKDQFMHCMIELACYMGLQNKLVTSGPFLLGIKNTH